MRTLTQRELNRALLARQGLLQPMDRPLHRLVEAISGLQAQYAPSAYVGTWSRRSSFERTELTSALERGSVVQATLMRSTIHIVSRRDYWPIALALRAPRRRWWLQATRHAQDAAALERAAARVRRALADGPRRRGDLVKDLGLDSATWNGVNLWLDMVRVPPSGTWERRRADLYGLAEDWIGPAPATVTASEGCARLVRRYLAGFGPASRKDVTSFTGLPPADVDEALRRTRLRRFRSEDGEELVDLVRGPLPEAGTPAPVRFLPTWDATLLVHARRTQILPERHRARVFSTKTPHSVCTFLVDGQAAGTWRYDAGTIHLDPFEPLARGVRRALEAESERLASFMDASAVMV